MGEREARFTRIERVAGALRTFAALRREGGGDPEDGTRFVRFFGVFEDRCHRARVEGVVAAALVRRSTPAARELVPPRADPQRSDRASSPDDEREAWVLGEALVERYPSDTWDRALRSCCEACPATVATLCRHFETGPTEPAEEDLRSFTHFVGALLGSVGEGGRSGAPRGPGSRDTPDESWGALLPEAESAHEDSSRGEVRASESPTLPPLETPTRDAGAVGSEAFASCYEEGVEALLRKAYPDALRAFRRAESARPGDPRVAFNIGRLEAMGFGRQGG